MSRHIIQQIRHPDGSMTIVYSDGTHDLVLEPVAIEGVVPQLLVNQTDKVALTRRLQSIRGIPDRGIGERERLTGELRQRLEFRPRGPNERLSEPWSRSVDSFTQTEGNWGRRLLDLNRQERFGAHFHPSSGVPPRHPALPWPLQSAEQFVQSHPRQTQFIRQTLERLGADLSQDYRDLRAFSDVIRAQVDEWGRTRETSPDAPFLGVPVGLLRSALDFYDNVVSLPEAVLELPRALDELLTATFELLSDVSRDPSKLLAIVEHAPHALSRLFEAGGEVLFGQLIRHTREAIDAAETGNFLTLSSRIIEMTSDILQLILAIKELVTVLGRAARLVARASRRLETIARRVRDARGAMIQMRARRGSAPDAHAARNQWRNQQPDARSYTSSPRRPAQVEWIEARGRSVPPPRSEGRNFSTARLADQHGDRFTWMPEHEGGAIVEVTMRYEPEHIMPRGPQHRPTSRAGRIAREATASEGGTVRFDAGHVRAAILDGIAEAITSFPQSSSINRGAWRVIEGQVRRLLSDMRSLEQHGRLRDPSIIVNLKFRYPSLGTRTPDEFLVSIRVPGAQTVRLRVANHPQLGYTVEAWQQSDRIQDFYGRPGITRLRSASGQGHSE